MAFTAHVLNISLHLLLKGYGATAARLTPDQKVGSSNLSGLTYSPFALSMSTHTENTKTYSKLKNPKKLRFGIDKPKANTANHCELGDNYLFPTSSQLSFLSHWTFWAWLYLLQGIHAVGGTERVRAGERLQ